MKIERETRIIDKLYSKTKLEKEPNIQILSPCLII